MRDQLFVHTLLQVDIGQGAKPPGYYVQHSYGLFPAPWPQDSTELPRICHLFELLGMFVAKCIQDGRRVDLPLSNPLFKLMCVPGGGVAPRDAQMSHPPEKDSSEEGDDSPPPEVSTDNDQEQGSNRNSELTHSNERLHSQTPRTTGTSSGNGPEGAERREASLKEAELLLLSVEDTEISKENSSKYEVTLEELNCGNSEFPWFHQILTQEDLMEVNPYRGGFLKQLRGVIGQQDAIQSDESLDSEEKERRLADIALPGKQENLPGAKIEDL